MLHLQKEKTLSDFDKIYPKILKRAAKFPIIFAQTLFLIL
jgi:hypothetical protein